MRRINGSHTVAKQDAKRRLTSLTHPLPYALNSYSAHMAEKVHSRYPEKKQGETSSSNYFAAFVFEAAAQTSKFSLIFENLLQNIERQTFYCGLVCLRICPLVLRLSQYPLPVNVVGISRCDGT